MLVEASLLEVERFGLAVMVAFGYRIKPYPEKARGRSKTWCAGFDAAHGPQHDEYLHPFSDRAYTDIGRPYATHRRRYLHHFVIVTD